MPGSSRTSRRTHRRAAPRAAPPALLAAAVRLHSDGILIAALHRSSGTLRVVFANSSFCTLADRAAADLHGAELAGLHAEAADAEKIARWLRSGATGKPLAGEGFLLRRDGRSISVAWSLAALPDRRGRLQHVVATYRDQTERRRLHDALMHAQRLDAVGRLAGGVAHDFNNLLSVINGYCEMLAAHVAANPQALREVAEIHNAGRKAAALTQQLLAFSRRQPLDARVLNFNALVRENLAILRRLVGDSGQVELELADDLANVRTDAAQFQQVLLNLVLNARDALRDHGRIVVTTTNREIKPGQNRRATDIPPGRYAVLTVTDNGTGMDAETQKHLFEPFFTTKPEGKGTGLGLALVYGVVQQSGGFIAVRSALLVGSTFEILLPAVADAVEAAPAAVAPLPSLRGNETVLLVEDDEVVRKMVEGMLTADGYRVTAVRSFAGLAASSAEGRPPQLLIANVAGDGEKTARRLRETHPALRVLATCQQNVRPVFTWLPPEHQACLNKPYALSELLRATRKLLDA